MRILLIDDDQKLTRLLAKALVEERRVVDVAHTGGSGDACRTGRAKSNPEGGRPNAAGKAGGQGPGAGQAPKTGGPSAAGTARGQASGGDKGSSRVNGTGMGAKH